VGREVARGAPLPGRRRAVILREMVSPRDVVGELRPCRPLLRGLRRDAGPDSVSAGAKLEESWSLVGARLQAVVEAFAWRVSPRPNREPPELRRALGEALAGLDEAYAALRARGELGAEPPPGPRIATLPAGRVLADPQGKPISRPDFRVAGNVVAASGDAAGQTWLVRQSSAGTRLMPVGPEVTPVLDGSGWGVWEEDGQMRAGQLDAVGDPAGDGAPVPPLERGPAREVIAALADGQVRAVVYRSGEGEVPGQRFYWLARSRDGGATWPELAPLTPGAKHLSATLLPEAARVDLVWSGDGSLHWLSLGPGSLGGAPAPRPLVSVDDFSPDDRPPVPCAAGSLTWWLIEGATYLARPGDQSARPIVGGADLVPPVSCAGDRLLARARGGGQAGAGRVVMCSASGCQHSTVVPGLDTAAVALALGPVRGPLVAVEDEGLLVLWSGDPDRGQPFQPAAAARMPAGQALVGLVEWDGQVSIITHTDEAVHVVPLALPAATSAPRAGATAG
jgi:hypothetical protein